MQINLFVTSISYDRIKINDQDIEQFRGIYPKYLELNFNNPDYLNAKQIDWVLNYFGARISSLNEILIDTSKSSEQENIHIIQRHSIEAVKLEIRI